MQVCFSDNDKLSALVASELDADLLVILSDVDGLFDSNPKEILTPRLSEKLTGLRTKFFRSVLMRQKAEEAG